MNNNFFGKILFGLIIVSFSSFLCNAQQQSVINAAMYAEIHGLPNKQCMRIYKCCDDTVFVHGKVKSLMCRKFIPHIHFFDETGKWISTQPLSRYNVTDERAIINAIQAQLTVLPIAYAVDVCAAKAPGNQWIELYDKDGHRIALVGKWGGYWDSILNKGDSLPQSAIDFLALYVRNPQDLKEMRIRNSSYSVW